MPDRHEQSKNEPSPLCINGGIPSPSFPPSSRKKMLAFLLSFLFIAALLCTSSDRLSIARGVPYPGAHVSIANALASDVPLTRQQVIARAQPSVVWILVEKKNTSGGYG
jgi:hypothetical protein